MSSQLTSRFVANWIAQQRSISRDDAYDLGNPKQEQQSSQDPCTNGISLVSARQRQRNPYQISQLSRSVDDYGIDVDQVARNKELLIQLVKEQEVLWRTKSKDKQKQLMAGVAWEHVQSAIDETCNFNAKEEWRKLRSAYFREKRAHQAGKQKPWAYYNMLQFLDADADDRESNGNLSEDDATANERALIETHEDIGEAVGDEYAASADYNGAVGMVEESRGSSRASAKRKRSEAALHEQVGVALLKRFTATSTKWDAFGQLVGITLADLPPHLALQAQKRMNDIMIDAEQQALAFQQNR